ncbi:MAG: hypothetical protein AVDCRST_MAG52-913, partial [uncultured Blastococcus sp.]
AGSPGRPRLAPVGRSPGVRGAVAASGGGRPGAGPRTRPAQRDGPGPADGGPRLEAGDGGAVHEGRAVRRCGVAAGAHSGARPASARPGAADPDPERGPRAPQNRGVVRDGAGLAGAGGGLPFAAARPGACLGPPADRDDGRRRVVGARRPDRVARLGVGPDALSRAGREPVGAPGPAPRARFRFAHRRPAVQPGAADDLRQARRPDRAAPAGDRRAVTPGLGGGAGGGLPRALLRLLPAARAGCGRSAGLTAGRRPRDAGRSPVIPPGRL